MLAGIVLGALIPWLSADAEPVHAPPPRKATPPARRGRETKAINDGWTFAFDPMKTGEAQNWQKTPPASARPITVPSFLPAGSSPGAPVIAWYFRQIDPPGSWLGQTVRLKFDAAADQARVWLNGELIGNHFGGATPFDFNITKSVKIGAKNLLAVRVEGGTSRGAGLWQGVQLMAHDEAYVVDVFPYGGPLGNMRAEVEINNTSDKSGDASLDARVVAAAPAKNDIKSTGQILSLTPKRNVTTMVVNVPKKRLSPWSPDTPSLYTLELVFHQDKDVLDTTETRFGFRDLGWKDGAITLNGLPLTLKSAAHEAVKTSVIATEQDRSAARDQMKSLKDAGVNVAYLEAPTAALLAIADEIGLFIVEGVQGGQNPASAESELLDLVRRDRSHPSILAWSIDGLSADVAAKVGRLDPTRFTVQRNGTEARLTLPHPEDQQTYKAPAGLVPR
jgi:beta-galactosidase/beta-glucuronidase